MFQNMKVDVIYYKTNTDFEMEFNLCGCCRMRLLTDKAPDRKTTVYALSRSVARSKIIITVGPLFGEEGAIATVAAAIGSHLVTVDNSKYAINSTSEIKIIDGSVPLVTSEGFFGGLIIEKGQQTMILLSESKSVRKTVMQELIHPYIAEIYAEELKGSGETPHFSADLVEAPISEEIAEKSEEPDDTELPEVIPNEEETDTLKIAGVAVGAAATVVSDILPEAIPTGEAIGVVKIADIAGKTATTVLADIAPDANVEGKTAVEAIEESLIVAQNDFLAENDPDSTFILDNDVTDERGVALKGGEYLLTGEEAENELFGSNGEGDIELLGETEENTDAFNLGGQVELIIENDEDNSPIPMEIPELLLEEDEHMEILSEDFDIPKGLLTETEESVEDFHFPEEQRVLLKDVEPTEKFAPMLQHTWVEGEDEDFILDENIAERKISRINIPILIFSFILLFIVCVIVYFMFIVPLRTGISPSDYIREIFDTLFG